jgi:hypothetical protein
MPGLVLGLVLGVVSYGVLGIGPTSPIAAVM